MRTTSRSYVGSRAPATPHWSTSAATRTDGLGLRRRRTPPVHMTRMANADCSRFLLRHPLLALPPDRRPIPPRVLEPVGATQAARLAGLMPVDNLGAAGQPVVTTRARAGLPRDRQEPAPGRLARVPPLRLRNRRLVLPFLLSRLKAHTFLSGVGRWRRSTLGVQHRMNSHPSPRRVATPRRTPPIHRHPPSYGVKVGAASSSDRQHLRRPPAHDSRAMLRVRVEFVSPGLPGIRPPTDRASLRGGCRPRAARRTAGRTVRTSSRGCACGPRSAASSRRPSSPGSRSSPSRSGGCRRASPRAGLRGCGAAPVRPRRVALTRRRSRQGVRQQDVRPVLSLTVPLTGRQVWRGPLGGIPHGERSGRRGSNPY